MERLIRSKTKDQNQIEHLLDGLLDFCGNEKMLLLFKEVCRYYFKINPQATVDYINIYRETWDSEEDKKVTKK